MSRDYRAYLEDILASIARIEKYTKGVTRSRFMSNEMI